MLEQLKILPNLDQQTAVPGIAILPVDIFSESPISRSACNNNEALYLEQKEILSLIGKTARLLKPKLVNSDIKGRAWDKVEKRRYTISEQKTNLMERILNDNEDSPNANGMLYMLRTAADILTLQTLRQQSDLVKGSEFAHDFSSLVQLVRFNYLGSLFMKIEDLSLIDIINNNNVDLSKYYKTTNKAGVALNKNSFEAIQEENKHDSLIEEYPQTSGRLIQDACKQIAALSTGDLAIFDYVKIPTKTQIEQEIILKAKELLEITTGIRIKLCNELFNSQSFRQLVSAYVIGSHKEKASALGKLGLGITRLEIGTYRAAKKMIRENDEDASFFANLVANIKDCAENQTPLEAAYAPKEIGLFLTDAEIPEKPIPTFEDLKNIMKLLPKTGLKPEYVITPCDVDYTVFKAPKEVVFAPIGNGHSEAIIGVTFNDEKKRGSGFGFYIDTENKHLEWVFLDRFDDPDMSRLAKASMLLTHSVLSFIQKKLVSEHPLEKPIVPQSNNHTLEKKWPVWTPKIKEKREKPQQPLSPIQELMQKKTENETGKNGFRKYIKMPTDEELQKLERRLSREIQEEVNGAIDEFNETGAGKFKMLNSGAKYKGKMIYELIVRDIRILMTLTGEQENKSNSREKIIEFKPFEIKQKQSIKRKQKNGFHRR
ncbi:MAG: hypothetical protein A3B47_03385 [Candidatus Levybacteria bacterium RIFCSPLOWO2_01_FULL_39_24]|nr:MAG: hypothetical protein A2800_02675 [Candidatus Levybacteria bacterium RIFCSPHIGHO2_01_FULL_40_16]OGH28228.1 MAG: hypothetical protein A3E12_00645 [Candidatus Levybacteria bacterium RIFCSPHIGHO2_12_FULL_39_9]OGH46663.1 MAG: hypothetical protein A3B47_03385 [Candidatus Levybacteria bacterium RIFCSPLOWO2_01_FULL_39_24]